MADVGRGRLKRLALQEYGPWAGSALSWVLVLVAVGTADAARLLAAGVLIRSLRYLTAPSTQVALTRRIGASAAVRHQAMLGALRLEGTMLALTALLFAALILTLQALAPPKTVQLCLLVALGLPARFLYPLAGGRRYAPIARLALTWGGASLALIAWFAGAGLTGFALALAAREWIALGAALLLARTEPPRTAKTSVPSWRRMAARSYRMARRRFGYRIGKGILTAFLGPIGNLLARTGRGVGVTRSLEPHVPTSPPLLGTLAVGGTAAALGLIAWWPEPSIHVVAASLFRIAAASGSILLWRPFRDDRDALEDEDEDDD